MENEMTMYEFSLVLSGATELTDALEDAVFDAGCDDALLGVREGRLFLEFDRSAATALEAVLSAIEAAEQVPGLTVCRVEPEDLVNAADIGARTGRTRESVRLLAGGKRGPGGFPRPVANLKDRTRFWRWTEVAEWFSENGMLDDPSIAELARAVAVVNGALELRRSAEQKEVLERLVG